MKKIDQGRTAKITKYEQVTNSRANGEVAQNGIEVEKVRAEERVLTSCPKSNSFHEFRTVIDSVDVK
jgi:hypothetical protein